MRLHIDGIIFSLQRYGGISVYFRELLQRMPADQAVLTLEAPTQQSDLTEGLCNVRTLTRQSRPLERVRPCRTPDRQAVDVFHSTYYRRPRHASQTSVVTVHDFVHEHYVPGPKGRLRRWLINSAVRQAEHIICISQATRDDLMRFAPVRADQKISVIHNGVADGFAPLEPQGLADKASAEPPFMLFVGQRGGYKNFGLALAALAHLPDVHLHCVGGGAFSEAEFDGISAETRSRVRHAGFVDDSTLNRLYNRALCLIYPSAYEGFGIPVLEAMRAGCPVVCIDCRAVVEVGGEALSISDDPKDPAALARAVLRVAGGEGRAQLRKLGLARSHLFSWDRCAQETFAVYQSLLR